MTMWNERLLPHPLLAYWTDDYGDATFVVSVPQAVLNSDKQISFSIKYHLTSSSLRELISLGQARYVCLVTCPKTFSRTTRESSHDEDLEYLDARDFAGEIRLTPYVVAVKRIEKFISPEHAQEIREIRPEGFTIQPGAILAFGRAIDITLDEAGSPYSVIDLVADPTGTLAAGEFNFHFDDNRIKIYVTAQDKTGLETLRQQGEGSPQMATLFASLYLQTVTEALRQLEGFTDKAWANSMRQALDREGVDADDLEAVKDQALKYAQILLRRPLGALLATLAHLEED